MTDQQVVTALGVLAALCAVALFCAAMVVWASYKISRAPRRLRGAHVMAPAEVRRRRVVSEQERRDTMDAIRKDLS